MLASRQDASSGMVSRSRVDLGAQVGVGDHAALRVAGRAGGEEDRRPAPRRAAPSRPPGRRARRRLPGLPPLGDRPLARPGRPLAVADEDQRGSTAPRIRRGRLRVHLAVERAPRSRRASRGRTGRRACASGSAAQRTTRSPSPTPVRRQLVGQAIGQRQQVPARQGLPAQPLLGAQRGRRRSDAAARSRTSSYRWVRMIGSPFSIVHAPPSGEGHCVQARSPYPAHG